jgi:hypothetical protein
MSRSRALFVTVIALLLTLPAFPTPADDIVVIDATGNVDYTHGRSSIQVGAWARYRIKTVDEFGGTDEYNSTLLIAGEEDFWGDEGFWVETSTERPGAGTAVVATLMSYSVFDDSLAIPHLQVYQRKKIDDFAQSEVMKPRVMRQGENTLRSRDPFGTNLTYKVDTLGTETVRTPKGDFVCRVIRQEQGAGQLAESADSSRYTEVRKWRTTYETLDVPVTHMAREVLESESRVRTWLVGRSQEAGPLRTTGHSISTVELVDFGTTGVAAQVIPEQFRRTLAEQRAEAARASRPKASARAKPAATAPARR